MIMIAIILATILIICNTYINYYDMWLICHYSALFSNMLT